MNDWFANCGEHAPSTCSCSSSGRNTRPCIVHDRTRVSQAPDWMVSGLMKAALFADQEPDQPMFKTGVTYGQLKAQVTAVLKRSGLDLTVRELGAATYWLTQRIANNISDSDTKETLMQKFNDFVAQYVVDKSVQRATGVSERSPIYDRKWYDENFTPPTDREAAVSKSAGLAENLAKLPPKCYAILPTTKELILIIRGEDGYTTITVHGQKGAKGGARVLNEALGVTPEQAEAMMIGSMWGWHVPGANPDMWKGKRLTVYIGDSSPEQSPLQVDMPTETRTRPVKMNPRQNSIFAAEKDSGDKSENESDVVDMVYVGLDGDDMGHLVEESLLTDDPEVAAKISNTIHDAHRAIRKINENVGGALIFDGGDNMLMYMPNEPDVFEAIREIHKKITKHTVTIGVGRRPIEAHYALVVGKNTGKDKTVIYSEAVKGQHDTIHQEQQQVEETQRKLKYRAQGEVNAAERIRQALAGSGQDSSDKAVTETFWRLVQQWDLGDMRAINLFFSAADDRDLLSAVRQTYAKRLDWNLRCSEARELNQGEGQVLFHSLIRAVESVEGMGPKFKAVMDAVDNQSLRDLDEGMERAWARAEGVVSAFAKLANDGPGTLRYSHYVDEVKKVAGEIVSMAIPVDQELVSAIKAAANAEDGLNDSVNLAPLVKVVNCWIEKVNTMAMALDMVCVVSGARPMEMVAADMGQAPNHFPGQTNVPSGNGQKSPYKRHDWLTIEDYNKDKVDWRRTDDQAGLSLPGDMAERSVGGDAGGSPIYVP